MKEKAVTLGKRILSHDLVKGSTIIFLGTMLTNVFAFFFNLLLVRKFSYAEYGEYVAVISLFALLSIPAQSLQPVLVRFSSEFISKKQMGKAERFYRQTFLSLILFSVLFFFVYFLLTPFLKEFFHIPDLLPILLIGLTICLAYISIPNMSFLQSMLKFSYLSFTTVLGSATKLGVGLLLIFLGFHVMGGLWAVWLSFLVPLLLSFIPLKNLFSVKEAPENISWREILAYGLPSTIALFALSSFTSTDVLLVKHFFSTNEAGLYGGLSLIGKVIFYFTAPITTVMFPLVIKRFEEKRSYHNLFFVALGLVSLPSLTLTLLYFLFPRLVVLIFLGGKQYQSIAGLLGYFGIFLTLFSLLNVFVNFFLSLKKTEVSVLVILGAILQAVLISLYHATFYQVIIISTIVTFVLLILLLFYYSKNYASFKNEK